MKYVVTAINRLTGLREAISKPASREKTDLLLLKAKQWRKKSAGQCPWLRPRVEPACREGELEFTNND